MAASRPLIYGSLLVACLALYMWASSEPEKGLKAPPKKTSASKSKDSDWIFPTAETSVHFEKPTAALRDIFKPLVAVDKDTLLKQQEAELLKSVPSKLAAGEANWVYTGMVEVDGSRLALLENSGTHQGGFVKEGDIWKKSKLLSVTSGNIIVASLTDGASATVYRYNPNEVPKPKAPPEGGFRPFDISKELRGPIGNIDISRIEETPSPRPRRIIR